MNRPAAERRERRQNRRHLIMDVRYALMAEQGRPMSEAPLLCRCGAVVTSGTWDRHRGLSDPIEAARLGGRNSRKGAA